MTEANNWIVLRENQQATYVVNTNFPYYLYLSAGSSVTFKSKTGNQIVLEKNIWGPGSMNMSCDILMKASIGVAPEQRLLSAGNYQYTAASFTEEI